MSIKILVLTLRFRAPWCRSLKDRRSALQPVLQKLRSLNVSAVESGGQDCHTLFDLTVAAIAFSTAQADSMKESILNLAETATEAELYDVESELL